jgi:hypothetical protein
MVSFALKPPETPKPRSPAVPLPRHVSDALHNAPQLASLMALRQQALTAWSHMALCLPKMLAQHVEVGGVDAQRFVLLASDAACAAKLRQHLPTLNQSMRQTALAAGPQRIIVVKVRHPTQS